jgi:hypothetical protein
MIRLSFSAWEGASTSAKGTGPREVEPRAAEPSPAREPTPPATGDSRRLPVTRLDRNRGGGRLLRLAREERP